VKGILLLLGTSRRVGHLHGIALLTARLIELLWLLAVTYGAYCASTAQLLNLGPLSRSKRNYGRFLRLDCHPRLLPVLEAYSNPLRSSTPCGTRTRHRQSPVLCFAVQATERKQMNEMENYQDEWLFNDFYPNPSFRMNS
jgi:hypothetical protein